MKVQLKSEPDCPDGGLCMTDIYVKLANGLESEDAVSCTPPYCGKMANTYDFADAAFGLNAQREVTAPGRSNT